MGGAVRDLLLGHPRGKDWDIATGATPDQVMALFEKTIPTGVEHGTVTVLVNHVPVEVTTFRGEADYTDGRRPDRVWFHEDIEEDLARRDFTINAIAWDPLTGAVRDPFGGLEDLGAGIVRAVGEAHARFDEDGLRLMRAVRFASVLRFALEEETHQAIQDTLGRLENVAVERISHELERLLSGPDPALGLRLLDETGLTRVVLPELGRVHDSARATAINAAPTEPESVRVAILLSDLAPRAALATCKRLRWPTALGRDVAALLEVSWRPHETPDGLWARRSLSGVGRSLGPALVALWRAWPGREAGAEALDAALGSGAPLVPGELAMDGRAIMEQLRLSPGPGVGRAVAWLMDRVLEDPSANTRAGLERLLGGYSGTDPDHP